MPGLRLRIDFENASHALGHSHDLLLAESTHRGAMHLLCFRSRRT